MGAVVSVKGVVCAAGVVEVTAVTAAAVVVDAVVDVVVEAVVVTAVSVFAEVLVSAYAVSGLVLAVASGAADVPTVADTVSGGVAVV